MTIHLRDRMAEELDLLGALGDDLVPDAVGAGRRRRRQRRLLESAGALAVVAAAAVAVSSVGVLGGAEPAGPTGAVEVRAAWADQVRDVFAEHLPSDFDGVVREEGGALQFLTAGPRGTVHLNAEVYVDGSIDLPTCATTGAEECREVDLPDGGRATVLVNVYTNRPDLPEASQVWVARPDGTRALLNAVETAPGPTQVEIDDLVDIATGEELAELLDLGVEHAGYLEGFGVNRPSR